MTMPTRLLVGAAILASVAASGLAAAPPGNPRPRLVVPKLEKAPAIDGKLAAAEWAHAAEISGFIAPNGDFAGRLAPYESRIFAGHDGTKLYLAVHVDLAPGSKPSRNYRKRDEPVYMDSHQMELWLTPPGQAQTVAYQFIGNAYGAIYDNRQVPALGNTVVGWNGPWEFRNHFETGKFWSAEIAVPFAAFTDRPVTPDQAWGALIGAAWPQRAWPYTHGWYKNVDSHALWSFSDQGACVRVDDLSPLLDNRLGARLTLVNRGGPAGAFTVRAAVGAQVLEKKIAVPAGATTPVELAGPALPEFAKAEKSRRFDLSVTTPDGTVLLQGDWPFAPVPSEQRAQKAKETAPWTLPTRVLFAPEGRGLKAWADLLDYPRRDQLAKVRFRLIPAGAAQAVLEHEVTAFPYDAAEAYLWLPKDLPYGPYELQTQLLSAAGAVLEEKTDKVQHPDLAKEFPWWNSAVGMKRTVNPPFTPVTVEGRKVTLWGREYAFEGALPAQIVSRGEKLLARPVSLVAVVDGQPVTATATRPVTFGKGDGVRAEFSGQYQVGAVTLDLTGRVEFDGAVFYELTATPGTGARVGRLYLSIPLLPARATTFFSTAGGWSPAFGIIAENRPAGPIWTSDEIADFVPYLALGDDDRALQWFADHDHDWVLGKDAPAASVERTADAVEMRIHFVRRQGALTQPFAASFGLIATPVKPLPSGWRTTVLDSSPLPGSKTTFMYGPGHGNTPIDLHDAATLAKVRGIELGGRRAEEVLAAHPPTAGQPIARDTLKAVLKNRADDALKVLESEKRGGHLCYFMNASMYFEGHRSAAFRTFFPGDWQMDPPSGWFHLTPTRSYRDFFAFYFDLWLKHFAVPGMYFDEVYIAPDYNRFNGNGKLLPDGSVRPSVPLTQQREFFQRLWQLWFDNGQTPFLWTHSSNFMAAYSLGVANVAMFGEDRKATPTQDYIDTVPAALFRAFGRAQKFGLVPVWMDQEGRAQGPLTPSSLTNWGWCWMHDVVPEVHTSSVGRPLWMLRTAWGIAEDDVEFVPYWGPRGVVETGDRGLIASAWRRPGGKLLLQVLNLKRQPAQATIRLSPPPPGRTPAIHDLLSHPAWAALQPSLAEYWRLKETDAAAAAKLAPPLLKALRDPAPFSKFNPAELKLVGKGNAFTVALPARGFGFYIVE